MSGERMKKKRKVAKTKKEKQINKTVKNKSINNHEEQHIHIPKVWLKHISSIIILCSVTYSLFYLITLLPVEYTHHGFFLILNILLMYAGSLLVTILAMYGSFFNDN